MAISGNPCKLSRIVLAVVGNWVLSPPHQHCKPQVCLGRGPCWLEEAGRCCCWGGSHLTVAREVQDSLKPALLLQTGGLSLSEPSDTNSRDSGVHPAIPLILPKVSAVNGVCLCLQGEPQVSTSVSPPSFFKSPKPG